MAEIERDVVLPFITKHPEHFRTAGAGRESALHALYRWATAVVSAYSFELGDDKYQVRSQVPAPCAPGLVSEQPSDT